MPELGNADRANTVDAFVGGKIHQPHYSTRLPPII